MLNDGEPTLGLFLDFATSFVVWAIICALVALVIARIRKTPRRGHYVRVAILVGALLAALSIVPMLIRSNDTAAGNAPRPAISDPFGRLSSDDVARAKAIMGAVVQDSMAFTPEIHAEFWSILEKAHLTREEEEAICERLAAFAVHYQTMFYTDALASVKQQKPVKSTTRNAMEKKLVTSGEISQQRIDMNDAIMAKIASRDPVQAPGGTVTFTEDIILLVLEKLKTGESRLKSLFTRPQGAR